MSSSFDDSMPDYKKRSIGDHEFDPESLMMSYGFDPALSEGALKCPIFQTSTFVFETAEEGKKFFELAYDLREKEPDEDIGLIYSRLNNPTLEILEDRLALWDDSEDCAMFESGMAAINTVFFEFLRPGDLLLYSEPLYGGTDGLIKDILPRYNIHARGFPASSSREEVEQILEDSGRADDLAMVFVETPANPTIYMVDIEMCSRIARDHGSPEEVPFIVDNTFLGPLWQDPLDHGADLSLYSATKYIGGHSDIIAGACLGPEDLMERIKSFRSFTGTMGGPYTGWLILRSLETLKLRMKQQLENARQLAPFLNRHDRVDTVYYPELFDDGDPAKEIYEKQCHSPGAMISFDIKGGREEAFQFLNNLELVHLAVSLGGTESLAQHPSSMTHADVDQEKKERWGISDQMIRLSVGVENVDDLKADLSNALANCGDGEQAG